MSDSCPSTGNKNIPTILLTNDDGPCSQEDSPFIYPFSQLLIKHFLGSPDRLKVVIPDSQKSWIGKAYLIKDKVSIQFYDPSTHNRSQTRPSLNTHDAQSWRLVSGTPASCSNLALFNLFPNQIDLVISGPNYGRNTSTAFSLSSGTIGAAMDAALSNHKAIALSYGIFDRPISPEILEAAHQIAIKIIQQLWHSGFDHCSPSDPDAADLYSVNIPLVPAILNDPTVIWSFESQTRYARLFLPFTERSKAPTKPADIDSTTAHPDSRSHETDQTLSSLATSVNGPQSTDFIFKPDISALIDPNASHHPIGSDAWALNQGYCTVTPLKAAFRPAQPPFHNQNPVDTDSRGLQFWKL